MNLCNFNPITELAYKEDVFNGHFIFPNSLSWR